jgi:hypothetical protein
MLLGIGEARLCLILLLQTILKPGLSLARYLKLVPNLKPCLITISGIYFCLFTASILRLILRLILCLILRVVLCHTTGTSCKC